MQFLNRFKKTESLSRRGLLQAVGILFTKYKLGVRNYIHAFLLLHTHTHITYISLYSYMLYIIYKFYIYVLCNIVYTYIKI